MPCSRRWHRWTPGGLRLSHPRCGPTLRQICIERRHCEDDEGCPDAKPAFPLSRFEPRVAHFVRQYE
eukprot:12886753-Prorocentrum_lima.AAC.1